MKPAAYLDVKAASSSDAEILPVLTKLMQVLHGISRNHPGKYALALPTARVTSETVTRSPGDTIRVFADTTAQLIELKNELEHHTIGDYIIVGRPRSVPDSFTGTWTSYTRFRVPTSKSRTQNTRAKLMSESSTLPCFRIPSKLTSQMFHLYVKPKTGAATWECEPDSYGLSVNTRPFALPDLPT